MTRAADALDALTAEAQRNGEYDAAPLVLVVPVPPTLTNSGKGRSRHWRGLEREKKAYWKLLDDILMLCDSFGAPTLTDGWWTPPPTGPFARVTLASHMTLRGHMDDDNAMARHKWLIDWLVTRGYLVSDRRTCVRWAALPTQRVSRQETARITLTITEEP